MNLRISRADALWAVGSLLAWLMLSLGLVVRGGGSSFTDFRAWNALFVFAIQGLSVHIWLFKRSKPKTISQALRKGVLLALLVLVLYVFSLIVIAWISRSLGLRGIDAICSVQFIMMIEALPFLLIQTLVGGSMAGFARWKSLAANANVSTGQNSPT